MENLKTYFLISEIDECLSSPCLNNGRCIDKKASYQCVCIPGFAGKLYNPLETGNYDDKCNIVIFCS